MTIPPRVRGIYATLHGWVIAKRNAHMGRFADLVVLKRWIGVQQLDSNDSSSLPGVYWLDYRFSADGADEREFPARRISAFLSTTCSRRFGTMDPSSPPFAAASSSYSHEERGSGARRGHGKIDRTGRRSPISSRHSAV